jgi:8-oxo-dGTP diphosphatase
MGNSRLRSLNDSDGSRSIVFHDESILLLQRSSKERFLPSVWGLPCGKIQYGETLQDAVLRELREEASIDGNAVQFAGSTWFTSQDARRRVQNLQVNFLVSADSTDVNLDNSSQDFLWLPLKDLDHAPVKVDAFTRKAIIEAIDARSVSQGAKR